MTVTSHGVTAFLTRIRGSREGDSRTDAELTGAFAESRSEGAFAELVRRFGPMVWGVCRRVVGDRQHAEDAFQATFLVLVHKAPSIRPPAAVGGWLHAVAVHTALRARALAARRRRREALHATVPDRPASEGAAPVEPELLRQLDEEIARLPDPLRAAVALCELGGVGRRDAARRLGIAEGTLSSRLAAARKRLAARLRSRGVVPGALAALASREATGAVPAVLAAHSRTTSALAEGVIRAMVLNKLTRATAGVLAAVTLLIAGLSVGLGAANEPPASASAVRRPAPVAAPKPVREGHILVWVDEQPQLLKPDGTTLPSPEPIAKAGYGVGRGNAQLSPDGTRLAFHRQGAAANMPKPPNGGVVSTTRTTLMILELDKQAEPKALDAVHVNTAHWLGDGKTLWVYGQEIGAGDVVNEKAENWVYDPATDKRVTLKVPEHFAIRAVGPDGKTAVADEWKMSAEKWHQRAHLWTIGTDKPTPLLDLNQSFYDPRPAFSPDGKRLLCRVEQYGKHTAQGGNRFDLDDFKCNDVVVIDLASKKRTVIKELGEEPEWRVEGLAWSPDGRKIAYVESQRLLQPPGGGGLRCSYRVVVADPDGKKAKEIHTTQGNWLVGFDWK